MVLSEEGSRPSSLDDDMGFATRKTSSPFSPQFKGWALFGEKIDQRIRVLKVALFGFFFEKFQVTLLKFVSVMV